MSWSWITIREEMRDAKMAEELLAKVATEDADILLYKTDPLEGEGGGVLLQLEFSDWEHAVRLTPQQALRLSKALWIWADNTEPGILLRAVEGEGGAK